MTVMSISCKLKQGTSIADFLAASDKIQEDYLSKCKGYVSRQLFANGDVWTDLLIWETAEDAENSMAAAEQNASAMAFTSLVGEVVQYMIVPLVRSYPNE